MILRWFFDWFHLALPPCHGEFVKSPSRSENHKNCALGKIKISALDRDPEMPSFWFLSCLTSSPPSSSHLIPYSLSRIWSGKYKLPLERKGLGRMCWWLGRFPVCNAIRSVRIGSHQSQGALSLKNVNQLITCCAFTEGAGRKGFAIDKGLALSTFLINFRHIPRLSINWHGAATFLGKLAWPVVSSWASRVSDINIQIKYWPSFKGVSNRSQE